MPIIHIFSYFGEKAFISIRDAFYGNALEAKKKGCFAPCVAPNFDAWRHIKIIFYNFVHNTQNLFIFLFIFFAFAELIFTCCCVKIELHEYLLLSYARERTYIMIIQHE